VAGGQQLQHTAMRHAALAPGSLSAAMSMHYTHMMSHRPTSSQQHAARVEPVAMHGVQSPPHVGSMMHAAQQYQSVRYGHM